MAYSETPKLHFEFSKSALIWRLKNGLKFHKKKKFEFGKFAQPIGKNNEISFFGKIKEISIFL